MSGPSLSIEPARPADAGAIADIYAHHVAHGTATYDTEPRAAPQIAGDILGNRLHGWPFLVARDADGTIAGYACAGQFRPRPAYSWTCEDSIYVRSDRQGAGVGRALLQALLEQAEIAGFRTMVAVIGGAEPASIALHQRCGFVHAGRLDGTGWKHGRWLDTVYMQRPLGEGAASPPPAREP